MFLLIHDCHFKLMFELFEPIRILLLILIFEGKSQQFPVGCVRVLLTPQVEHHYMTNHFPVRGTYDAVHSCISIHDSP